MIYKYQYKTFFKSNRTFHIKGGKSVDSLSADRKEKKYVFSAL